MIFDWVRRDLPANAMNILLPSTPDGKVNLPPSCFTWNPTPHYFRLPGCAGYYAREVFLPEGVEPISVILPKYIEFLSHLHSKNLSTEEEEEEGEDVREGRAIRLANNRSKTREEGSRQRGINSMKAADGKKKAAPAKEEALQDESESY
jgi:hypothetical protein